MTQTLVRKAYAIINLLVFKMLQLFTATLPILELLQPTVHKECILLRRFELLLFHVEIALFQKTIEPGKISKVKPPVLMNLETGRGWGAKGLGDKCKINSR